MRSFLIRIYKGVLILIVGFKIVRAEFGTQAMSTCLAATRLDMRQQRFLSENNQIIVCSAFFHVENAATHLFIDPSHFNVQ